MPLSIITTSTGDLSLLRAIPFEKVVAGASDAPKKNAAGWSTKMSDITGITTDHSIAGWSIFSTHPSFIGVNPKFLGKHENCRVPLEK